jgi:hypothetical protein
MRKGFTVETRHCDYWDTVLVVTNYKFSNLVVSWPMIEYTIKDKTPEDVGMWKVKTLKK